MNNSCENNLFSESDDRFQQLVHFIPDGLIVYVNGRIEFANKSALKLVGLNHLDEMIGQLITTFIHPDYAAAFTENIQLLIQEGCSSNVMYTKLLRSDAVETEVEVRAAAATYVGDSAIQLIIHDLSTRRRMPATSNETESLYKGLLDNVATGVFLAQNDRIIYANSYLADLYGYSVQELLDIKLQKLVDEEEIFLTKQQLYDSLRQGEKQFVYRTKAKRKDGSIIDLEANTILIQLYGQPTMLASMQDVTYKCKQEQQLRDHATHYQKIVNFIPEALALTDNGIIIYVNKLAVEMLGAQVEADLIGKHILTLTHPNYHVATKEKMKSMMTSEEATPFQERVLLRMDEQQLDVEISSILIQDYMGKDVVLHVIHDLTERKLSEEMFVRSEKLSVIGQLAAGVAHEIRNPLTSLKGFTQLLKTKYSEHHHYFDIMAAEIDRINLIVNEFMTLAKPHFSQFHWVALESILHSVISILETQAILLNVELDVSFEGSLPTLYCSENQLKQVFLNVIKNALDAMPEGGVVTITAGKVGDQFVYVRITDCGIGISEDMIKKIGEPFVTTKENGTGLGLMISTRIVEAHKGTLQLSSVKNEGTTVEIRLPLGI